MKRQVRFATNFLNAARQIEVFSGVTAVQVDTPTTRPSPPVGTSWTDSFEGTIGVATHHDGMSGTERQSVADDYEQRISESHFEVEAGVALALQKISGYKGEVGHCNCNEAGNCLNMSVCAFTTGNDEFAVVAWNPQGQAYSSWLRLPVVGAGWTVTDASTGKAVSAQSIPLDNRTLGIPLLYINNYGMKPAAHAAAVADHTNPATHTVTFAAALPPVGYATFKVKKVTSIFSTHLPVSVEAKRLTTTPSTISNGIYEITIDQAAGAVTAVKNLKSGASASLALSWGYYESSAGGCTYLPNGTKSCSSQASGAYIFRPINQTTTPIGDGRASIVVTQGPLVTEITQTFADWATHVIRLSNNSDYIEVEWTAGPIPTAGKAKPDLPAPGGCVGWKQTQQCDAHGKPDPKHDGTCDTPLKDHGMSGYCACAHGVNVYGDGCGGPSGFKTCTEACNAPVPQRGADVGKEIILKFTSDLASKGLFYTDSNGREMVKRIRNGRGPSYPPLQVNEPVAGNYYPVNSLMSLDDGKTEMAVVTDVSMGGASMNDGELELMVHRRLLVDDHRGVQEPLNETMCGCNDIGAAPGSMGAHGHEGDGGCYCAGLTMRGVSYIVVDTVDNAHATRRKLIERLNFPPTLAFATGDTTGMLPSYSAVGEALPENIKMMTLTNNYADFHDGMVLLRIAHMYEVDEQSALSAPVEVNLGKVFAKAGFTLQSATETTLTGNQPVAARDASAFKWETEDPTGGKMYKSDNAHEVRTPFDAEALTVTVRPMEVRTFIAKLA